MRRLPSLTILAAAILLLFPGTPASPAEKNLVDNPSFEDAGDDPVPGWILRKMPGRTTFHVADGKVVMERKEGTSGSADQCVQKLYLPQDALALRIRVVLALTEMRDAEIGVRFKDPRGAPLGWRTLFPLAGTRPLGALERDILLPEGIGDLTFSFLLRGPGRIVVDEVDVRVIAPEKIRGEAKIVRVTGRMPLPDAGGTEWAAMAAAILPAATDTQCPVAVKIAPSASDGLSIAARVVVTELKGFRSLPDPIPISPARHLPRKFRAWSAVPDDPEVKELAKKTLEGATDLLDAAGRVAAAARRAGAKDPAARVRLARDLLRAGDVAARAVWLVPIGGEGPAFAVEAYSKEHGWLRFGVAQDDPRPLPFSRDVRLGDLEAAPSTGLSLAAEEIGSVTLPEGAGPDLVSALAKPWRRLALRSFKKPDGEAHLVPDKVSLRGEAKDLTDRLVDILGSAK
ncbi:MAG: hypothetical protein ACYTDY_03070 [Planctomycetota bacterium]|jgi:hypothetical protein